MEIFWIPAMLRAAVEEFEAGCVFREHACQIHTLLVSLERLRHFLHILFQLLLVTCPLSRRLIWYRNWHGLWVFSRLGLRLFLKG
jgi:hypothetical protein